MTAPLIFDEAAVRADFEAGYRTSQIARRHGLEYEAMRQVLKRLGLSIPLPGHAPRVKLVGQQEDKIIVLRHRPNDMASKLLRHRISLPRVAMHIAELEERRP